MAIQIKLSRLHLLHRGAKVESLIIIVPDVGSFDPDSWFKSYQQPWLPRLLESAAPNSSAYLFKHDLGPGQIFRWENLLEKGNELLECLQRQREEDETIRECPLILISFGLGGFISKNAIQIAQKNHGFFVELLKVLCGQVLVCSPHLTKSNKYNWYHLFDILKLREISTSGKALHGEELLQLVQCCDAYQKSALDLPVLTIHQDPRSLQLESYSNQLKILARIFATTTSPVIGRELAKVGVRHEEIQSCRSDYPSLYRISPLEEAFAKMSSFVRESFNRGQWNIMIKRENRKIISLADNDTIRSPSTTLEGNRMAESSSARSPPAVEEPDMTIKHILSEKPPYFRKPDLSCIFGDVQSTNSDLFGREDVLKMMKQKLLPGAAIGNDESLASPKTFILCGDSGFGKTALAEHFMDSQKDKYDAVFWIQADTRQKIEEGYKKTAIRLGLEEPSNAEEAAASTSVFQAWLSDPLINPEESEENPENLANWLLILNDVKDPKEINDFRPQFGKGAILITSREPLESYEPYFSASGTNLRPLELKHAASYLLHLTKSNIHPSESKSVRKRHAFDIAHRAGQVPLVLLQMAQTICQKQCTFKEFLDVFDRKNAERDLGNESRSQTEELEDSIILNLELERLDKMSSDLLKVILLMNADGIKEHILHGSQSQAVCLEMYPRTADQFHTAVDRLCKRALIAWHKEDHEICINHITQRAFQKCISPEDLSLVFNAAASLLSSSWPYITHDKLHSTSRWNRCEAIIPHVFRLNEIYMSKGNSVSSFVPESEFVKLLLESAWYLHERGYIGKYDELLDSAESICENLEGDTRDYRSRIQYIRGAGAAETNLRTVAYTNNIKFLNLRLEISKTSNEGSKDSQLAKAYNQAGNAYLDQEDIPKAISLYEKALKTYRSLDDYGETMETICVANLGTALWMQGRNQEAFKILDQNLNARYNKFGVNHDESFQTGRLLHVLGNVSHSQGYLGDSMTFHAKALSEYKRTIGERHHRTADMMSKMAGHHRRLGRYDEARTLLEQARSIYEDGQVFEPELARTHFLLSQLLTLQTQNEEASQCRSKALSLYRKLRPSDEREDENVDAACFDRIVCFASR